MLVAAYVLNFVMLPVTIVFGILLSNSLTLGGVMSEIQAAVDAVVDQLSKAKGEIVSEIAKLEAAVVAGEPVDLTALKDAAQALDDVVVDVPVADAETA